MSKVAVVTGAGSGIGRAVALGLRGEGYSVVIAGRRAEELRKTASIACEGPEMLVAPTDVAQPEEAKLSCRLESFQGEGRRSAHVVFTGEVRGMNEDGPTRILLRGHFDFDLESRCLPAMAWMTAAGPGRRSRLAGVSKPFLPKRCNRCRSAST